MSKEIRPSSCTVGMDILRLLGIPDDFTIRDADIRLEAGQDIEVTLNILVPYTQGVDFNQAGTDLKRFTIIAKED